MERAEKNLRDFHSPQEVVDINVFNRASLNLSLFSLLSCGTSVLLTVTMKLNNVQ